MRGLSLLLPIWFLVSLVLSGMFRAYAIRSKMIDIPNHRSSHSIPTPRGGGIAVVFVFVAGLVTMYALQLVPAKVTLVLVLGGALVAGVGWVDDRSGLSPGVRFLVHGLAASVAVYCLGGLPTLTVGSMTIEVGWIGSFFAVVGIIWAINLYNFMDGIDGLAISEAVIVASGAAMFGSLRGDTILTSTMAILAAASLGFLPWNWSPAKVFMGDVCSGFLGFVFSVMAIVTHNSGGVPLLAWILMFGVFVVDSTSTLVRRVLNREKWYKPHRSHAYQILVQRGMSHKTVTVGVVFLDLLLVFVARLVVDGSRIGFPLAITLLVIILAVQLMVTRRARPNRVAEKSGA